MALQEPVRGGESLYHRRFPIAPNLRSRKRRKLGPAIKTAKHAGDTLRSALTSVVDTRTLEVDGILDVGEVGVWTEVK